MFSLSWKDIAPFSSTEPSRIAQKQRIDDENVKIYTDMKKWNTT